MQRDVYADATSCEADWTTEPLACEPFIDRHGVAAESPGVPRYYGPIYPSNKRPLSIQTASGVRSVGARMERRQTFTQFDRDVTGVSADGQITRGGFGRCVSASS
jgi:hypothetical protein